MLANPVDIAIVAGLIVIVFGPKKPGHPPWRLKVETNEKPNERKRDPFEQERPDSFFKNVEAT